MGLFDKKNVIKITKEDLKDAKLSAVGDNDIAQKRAFINVLGARLAMKMLFEEKIEANNVYSLYTIQNILKRFNIADIYCNNLKIDVRIIFNREEIFFPKEQYENELTPDLYLVLELKPDFSVAEFLGSIEPSKINKINANKDYYFAEFEELMSLDDTKNFIENYTPNANAELTDADLKKAKQLFLPFIDNNITRRDFKFLLNSLANNISLRESLVEFENFELISTKVASSDLLQDGMLGIVGAQDAYEDDEPINDKAEIIGEVLTDLIEGDEIEKPKKEEKSGSNIGGIIAAGAAGAIAGAASASAAEAALTAGNVAEMGIDALNALSDLPDVNINLQNNQNSDDDFLNELKDNSTLAEKPNEIANDTEIVENSENNFDLNDLTEDNTADLSLDDIVEDTDTPNTLEEISEEPEVSTEENNQENLDDLAEELNISDNSLDELAEIQTEPQEDNLEKNYVIEENTTTASLDELSSDAEDSDSISELEPIEDLDLELESEPNDENEFSQEIDDLASQLDELIGETSEAPAEKIEDEVATDVEFEEQTATIEDANLDKLTELEEPESITEDSSLEQVEQPQEVQEEINENELTLDDTLLPLEDIQPLETLDEINEVEEINEIQEEQPAIEENIENTKEQVDKQIEDLETLETLEQIEPVQELDNIKSTPIEDDLTSLPETTNEETLETTEATEISQEQNETSTPMDLGDVVLQEVQTDEAMSPLADAGVPFEGLPELSLFNNADDVPDYMKALAGDTQTQESSTTQDIPFETEPVETVENTAETNNTQNTNDNIDVIADDADDGLDELAAFGDNSSNENTNTNDDIDETDSFISEVDSLLSSLETFVTDENSSSVTTDNLDDLAGLTEETIENSENLTEPTDSTTESTDELAENDPLKVLFKEGRSVDMSLFPTGEKIVNAIKSNKKMAIAAAVTGVVITSFVVGGIITNTNKNNQNIVAQNAQMEQMQAEEKAKRDAEFNDSLPAEDVPNNDMPTLGGAPQNRDMEQAMSNAFTNEPVNADVTKIAWEVPEQYAYNDAFRQYLQVAGKNLKLNLQNELLLSDNLAYSDRVIVDIVIEKNGNIQSCKITRTSGSKGIDKIVLQSVNETLRYLKVPTEEINGSSVNATLIISF